MNGKQQTLTPGGAETSNAMKMKCGAGDYVGEIKKLAKFDFDRTKSGAPQEREIYTWRYLFLGF